MVKKITKKDKDLLLFFLCIVIIILFVLNLVNKINQNYQKDPKINKNHQLISKKSTDISWINMMYDLKPEDLQSKILLIEFIDYSNQNLLKTINISQKIQNHFQDQVIRIQVTPNDSQHQQIIDQITKYHINYPVIRDNNSAIQASFHIGQQKPSFILLNPDGNIEKIYPVSKANYQDIKQDIDNLITRYQENLNDQPLEIITFKNKSKNNNLILKYPIKLEFAPNFSHKNQEMPVIFISNLGSNEIFIITIDGKIIDKIGNNSQIENVNFNLLHDLKYNKEDKTLLVADTSNNTISKIDFKNNQISNILSQGQIDQYIKQNNLKKFTFLPNNIEFLAKKDQIFISNITNSKIILFDLKTKEIIDILSTDDQQNLPIQDFNKFDQNIYLIDKNNLYKINEDRQITNILEDKEANFSAIYADDTGIYLLDKNQNSILKFNQENNDLSIYAGQKNQKGLKLGKLDQTQFNQPSDIISIVDRFFVSDSYNHRLVIIDRKNQESSLLDILPQLQISKKQISTLIKDFHLKNITQSNIDTKINITLKKDWKINKNAPSFLNLISINDNKGKIIKHFNWQEITSLNLELPKLQDQQFYYLTGTIYYCQDKQNALCHVKKISKKIKTDQSEINNLIDIKL